MAAKNKEFLKWFYKRFGIPESCQASTLEHSLHFKNCRETWNAATEAAEANLQAHNSAITPFRGNVHSYRQVCPDCKKELKWEITYKTAQ